MRKIKELEKRIEELENARRFDISTNNNKYELIREWLNRIETKQKEQEDFLKNTVAPFIANSLKEELDKGLIGLADALADLFAEEPKKKTKKESKDEKKNAGKPKQKKENK